jgi:EAL domain-containing protein (putative c-di-GMP-specific phosphodiesterase class I)
MPGSPDAAPPTQALRLMGLAFAGADLVFEVDADGIVTFVLGATERLTGRSDTALVGRSWLQIVCPDDADLLVALLSGIQPGERQGPLRVALPGAADDAPARYAGLSVFRLPQLGSRLSCAMTIGPPVSLDGDLRHPAALMDRNGFSATATQLMEDAERAGLALRMDLVELSGLQARLAGLPPDDAGDIFRRIAATLRADSYGGLGAAEIGPDRFALIRPAGASPDRLAERVVRSAGVPISAKIAELNFEPGSVVQNLRAMRYALDRYIEAGPTIAAQSFRSTVARTVRETIRFKALLGDGAFQLAYQPVVELKDGQLHHFEALARFDANSGPAETIRLAEELGMITEFDLSVIRGVARMLGQSDTDVCIAANISAQSLMNPRFIDELAMATAPDPAMRPRLFLEITETARLPDLAKANRVIAHLREMGHVVCLDDFGAGSASLDYIRVLDVDVVKIDGRYIRDLQTGSRDAIVVKHVVRLCQELGLTTIAEMIETQPTARTALELGVDLGQGWAFSKPLPEPKWTSPPLITPVASRRLGAREVWG